MCVALVATMLLAGASAMPAAAQAPHHQRRAPSNSHAAHGPATRAVTRRSSRRVRRATTAHRRHHATTTTVASGPGSAPATTTTMAAPTTSAPAPPTIPPTTSTPATASPAMPAPAPAVVVDHPCTDQAVASCLLPYPSDRWLVPDPTSATGVRVSVPDDIMPASVLSQFGPGASIDDAFGGADGFSAVGPVVFELADPVDPATLPADGGDAFVVVDLTTGRRVPIRAEVSLDADLRGAGNRIVMAWPAVTFPEGDRFVAVVTDALRGPGGVALRPSPGLVASADLPADEQARIRALQRDADGVGRGWSHDLSATSFTVRSTANVTGDLDRMATIIRSEDHPIRNVTVGPSIIGGAAAVTGQVRVTDFRDADGVIHKGAALTHQDEWIDFLMTMPDHPAGPAGAPVVIYGHGITVSKETMLVVAGQNAAKGLATVGVDVPNHGSRQDEGGYILDLTNPQKFGRLASMPLQGEMDELSLLMAVEQHFGSLDTMPYRWWNGTWGDGTPDLDPTNVLYEGTSMGSFLGASFVALAPELRGAFLQVGGSGIIDTLYHSILWPFFLTIEPGGTSAGDAEALVGAASMLLDPSDNTYLLSRIRAAGTPLWLVYAANDGVVPNTSSNRMTTLLDLPFKGTAYAPVPPVLPRVDAMPADGIGVSQIPTATVFETIAGALLAHTSFSDPAPTADLNEWLDGRLASMHLAAP